MGYTALLMTLVLILIAVFYTLGLGWISYCLILLFSIFLSIESPAKLGIQKELFGVKRLTLSNAYQSSFSILGVVVSFVTIGISPEETSFLKDMKYYLGFFVIIGAIATLAAF